jgi:hypothetical protein
VSDKQGDSASDNEQYCGDETGGAGKSAVKKLLPERSDERARSQAREQYEPPVGEREWSTRDYEPESGSDAKNGPEPGKSPACPGGDCAPGVAPGFAGTDARSRMRHVHKMRVTCVTGLRCILSGRERRRRDVAVCFWTIDTLKTSHSERRRSSATRSDGKRGTPRMFFQRCRFREFPRCSLLLTSWFFPSFEQDLPIADWFFDEIDLLFTSPGALILSLKLVSVFFSFREKVGVKSALA